MAWVETVSEEAATGRVAELYGGAGQAGRPEVPEVMKVFSPRPDLLAARITLGNTCTFGGSGLGRFREELIATSISAHLACRF